MSKNNGWISVWRSQFEHWTAKSRPWCEGYAWIYLCARANHKKGIANFNDRKLVVQRGEFITSKVKLSKVFGWSYNKVTRYIEALKKDDMLRIETTNKCIRIWIQNYDKYQKTNEQTKEQTKEQVKELAIEQTNKQTRTNNNSNKFNNINKQNITGGLKSRSPYAERCAAYERKYGKGIRPLYL